MMILNNIRLPLIAAAAALMVAGSASATWGKWNWPPRPAPTPDECVVKAYADDRNEPKNANGSWNNDEFWSISFKQAVCDTAYIKEVTLDLRAGSDTNAYFDLSGGDKGDKAFGPKIGKLDGLSKSDVTFTPDTEKSSTLTLTFKDGAFKAGDRIWFGADTDNLGDNNASSVGWRGVGISVTFGNGVTYSSQFSEYARCLSKSTIKAKDCCGPTAIPTPSAAGLGFLMLGGLAVRRRRAA